MRSSKSPSTARALALALFSAGTLAIPIEFAIPKLFPYTGSVDDTIEFPEESNHRLGELAQPKICAPELTSYSGYFHVGGSSDGARGSDSSTEKSDDGIKYFFWFFQANHTTPSSLPTVLWLTGGPGCSSLIALLSENGPCTVTEDGKHTKVNPYSWTQFANVIWLDQPTGTGFSEGNLSDFVSSEHPIAKHGYHFLQHFFTRFPEFNHNVHIVGESYGGHYVPVLTRKIYDMNNRHSQRSGLLARFLEFFGLGQKGVEDDEKSSGGQRGYARKIDLKGFAIGNGLTNPEVEENRV